MPITGYSNTISVTTALDADALAYINALSADGYPLEAPEQTYINTLVTDFKSAGIWSKMKAIYPYCTSQRNLIGYSEDFGNASWNKVGTTTITTNVVTAPNGTMTADRFQASASNRCCVYQTCYIPSTIGLVYNFSIYAKVTSGTQQFRIGADQSCGNPAGGKIVTVTTDWQRFDVTLTSPTTSGFLNVFFDNITNNTTLCTGTTIDSDIYIWGAQLELGSTATTYQPVATTASTIFASQFKYNLKDPRNLDAAFRQVFNGGWTYSKQGATPNGTNGYSDTKLVPSSVLQLNSVSHSVYSRSASPTGIVGGVNDASNYLILNTPTTLSITSQLNTIGGDFITGVVTNLQGLLMANRTSSSVVNAWRNSTKVATDSKNSTSQPTINYFVGARNNGGSAGNFDAKQYGFYHIGDGLTDTEASAMYTSVQSYQTSMNRQV